MNEISPIPPVRPGRGPLALSIDRLRQAAVLRSRSRPCGAGGIVGIDAAGSTLGMKPRPSSFMARVNGGGPYYTFAEVYGSADSSGPLWVDYPNGRDTNYAYELNGKPVPAGSVVKLHPVGGGLWYWFLWRTKPPTTPTCPATLHVEDRPTGMPIAGVPIVLTPYVSGGTLPTVTSGTTDSDGNWTLPSIPCTNATKVYATVTYDGVSLVLGPFCDSSAYCPAPINICYCKGIVNVTTLSTANLTWQELPGGANRFVKTGSSGNYTFTYKELILCNNPSYLPVQIMFVSHPPNGSGYLNNCTTVTVHCDDNLTVPLPLTKFTDCHIQSPCCFNAPCGIYNEDGDNHALTPLGIQVRFTTVQTGAGDRIGTNAGGIGTAGGTIFEGDEAAWVTPPWVGIVAGVPTWDTGCRGAQGNYVGCPSGTLNGLAAGDVAKPYSGTRIIVTDCLTGVPYDTGVHYWQVTYIRYGDACPTGHYSSTTVGGVPCPNVAHGFWQGSQTSVLGPGNICLVSPLDQTAGAGAGGSFWTAEIRELACTDETSAGSGGAPQ